MSWVICQLCDEPFPSERGREAHLEKYCEKKFGPKEPCDGIKKDHQGYHVHEMNDGTWAIYFDHWQQANKLPTQAAAQSYIDEKISEAPGQP